MWQHVVQLVGSQVEQRDQENAKPPADEEHPDGPNIVPSLRGEAAKQRLPLPQMVKLCVPLNGARNLETWRAQQADPFVHLAIEWNHGLCPEEAVVARPASRGVVDVVAHEVVRPDRRSRDTEGGARHLVIHQIQPVGNYRSAADEAQGRVPLYYLVAEIRPGLHDAGKVSS